MEVYKANKGKKRLPDSLLGGEPNLLTIGGEPQPTSLVAAQGWDTIKVFADRRVTRNGQRIRVDRQPGKQQAWGNRRG
jgi:hypothetical protein